MSSSSSPAPRGFGGPPRNDCRSGRGRVLRGVVLDRSGSPLMAELPRPAEPGDPAGLAAEVQRGYEDGFEAGRIEGLAAGQAAAAAEAAGTVARLQALSRVLASAADDLRRRQALELTGLEDTLARAAVDLAAAVVGRELEVAASPGADALARALALVPAGSTATARLHPADAALLDAGSPGDAPGPLTIIPDPAVEPGGCVLEVGDSRIDAQLGPALDRVRSALLADQGRTK